MAEKKIVLTHEGLQKMEQELQHLKTVKRKEVAQKIKEARGQGDLSENAEYDSAKEEQAEIEARIIVLEKMLRNAEVIDEEELSRESVGVGSTIEILEFEARDAEGEAGEKFTYTIVGSAEADPFNGRISNESPLGEALLGHSAGDVVSVPAPIGMLQYKILEIL